MDVANGCSYNRSLTGRSAQYGVIGGKGHVLGRHGRKHSSLCGRHRSRRSLSSYSRLLAVSFNGGQARNR